MRLDSVLLLLRPRTGSPALGPVRLSPVIEDQRESTHRLFCEALRRVPDAHSRAHRPTDEARLMRVYERRTGTTAAAVARPLTVTAICSGLTSMSEKFSPEKKDGRSSWNMVPC